MNEEENIKEEPWEEEANYSEENETIDNFSDENIEENASEEETQNQEEHQDLDVNKTTNFLKYSIGFVIRSAVAIILSIFALKFILPSNSSDVFYKLYFVLFIVFELGVLTCYVFTNRSIFLLQSFSKSITEKNGRYSSLNSNNKKVNDVCTAYKKSFLVSDDEDYHKTRANSDLYFGSETWLQDTNPLPLQAFLKIIPGTFIGFGILGTFIGFAGGLSSINISDSQSLLDSVQQLLNGLRNAFNTSIVGMLASMFCNFVLIHPLFNKLDSVAKEFCDYLDNQFYVTEVDAMAIIDENNNKIPFPVVLTQILTKLEGVSSNINSMGLTIGDQVTKSVKETLDKTIEKIIEEEITKLKTDLNSSIKLLEECQTSLQNAPQHLKNAANVLENSAKNSSEIFEKFSDDLIDIKNAVSLLPDEFKNVNESISGTVFKLADNQTLLASAISEASEAFEKTTEISQSLSDSYDDQTEKINESISRFSDILTEYKETSKESKELLEGYKGMDIMIGKIFNQINENTEGYSKIIGDSLEKYIKSFKDATKDISKQFADATLALSEEVRRLNGANDTTKAE